ncbi:hypothetical protein CEP51_012190 [Fusarium floridanum]|uniref:Uncharacterized protein n=1 Tax=Fusarium floridanum TaxID=1325733 RepID=A0A428QYS2_9HYPO|nr:hypothetical protein CEP51_012190 [Fusarium floridanum]
MAEEYDQGDLRLISVRFRFKANTLSAIGRYTDAEHPNVLRLTIVRSAFNRAIIRILLALPYTLQNLARALVPGYFLPSRIILKKIKLDWDDEFDNEVCISRVYYARENGSHRASGYAKLSSLLRYSSEPPTDGPSVWDQLLATVEIEIVKHNLDIDWTQVEVFCSFILNKRGSQTRRQRDSSIKLKEEIDRIMKWIVKLIRDRGQDSNAETLGTMTDISSAPNRWREDVVELC